MFRRTNPQLFTVMTLSNQEKEAIYHQNTKVFAYVNMDAFFAQIQASKLFLDPSVPFASTDQGICFSVNDSAFKRGIREGMTMKQAKSVCQNIKFAQVDSFKILKSIPAGYTKINVTDKAKILSKVKDKKVVDYYKGEWDRIFHVFRKCCPLIEMIEFGHFYLDISEEAAEFYKKSNSAFFWKGMILGGEPFTPEIEQDVLLVIGSQILERISKELTSSLKYSFPVGISYNKMLARLATQGETRQDQFIIVERYASEAIKDLDITNLKGLNKDLTSNLQNQGFNTFADIQKLSLEELQYLIPNEQLATSISNQSRGIEEQNLVNDSDLRYKSIIVDKPFSAKANFQDLEREINHVLKEFTERILAFYDENKVVPTRLVIKYFDNPLDTFRVLISPLNLKIKQTFHQIIKDQVFEQITPYLGVMYPCTSFGLLAKHFEQNDVDNYEFTLPSYSKLKSIEIEPEQDEFEKFREPITRSSSLLTPQFSQDTFQQPSILSQDSDFSPQEISSTTKCEKCKLLIQTEDFKTHYDFHLAQDLDKELNPNKKSYKRLDPPIEDLTHVFKNQEKPFVLPKKKIKSEAVPVQKQTKFGPLDRFFVKK